MFIQTEQVIFSSLCSPFLRKFSNRRSKPASFASKHLPLLPRRHYSSMQIVASLMDFSLSSPFFDFPFQFLSLHVLIFVCTQFRHLYSCRPLSQHRDGPLLNTQLHCASKLPEYYCFRQHRAVF